MRGEEITGAKQTIERDRGGSSIKVFKKIFE